MPGVGGGTFRLDTTYTTAGQRATLRYPGGNAGQPGEIVTFGYNAVGQLNSVTSDDGTQYVASTTYNAQGQVTEQRMDSGANGFTRQSAYNANTLRLETLKAGKMTPYEDLQKFAYTYDLAGNVQTLTDATNSGQVQTFGYDWLDRLTTAATSAAGVGQYSHTYAYNAIGNLTSYNGNAYAYGSQPHAVTGAFGNAYGYDAVGNQISRTIAGTAYTQSFDYDNRLLGVVGGSVNASFLYDADGNRVKGTVAGVSTVYIAGLYEYQNGAVTKYYEGGAIRRTGYATDNGVFYTLSDQLRSTSVLVNQNGTVKDRNYYYPYGGNRGGSAFSGITTKRFTGQYHEQGLPGGEGLAFYNARWYDAQVGVFISADTLVPSPLAPQTFNRYAYAIGNPLKFVDPSGHAQCRTSDECADIGSSPMGRRAYIPKFPAPLFAWYHRNLANGPHGSKQPSLANMLHYAWLGAGSVALQRTSPQAAQSMLHYLGNSGEYQRIDVPAVLQGSSSHSRVVAGLKRELLSLANFRLEHAEGGIASFDLHTTGTDQFGHTSSWQYKTMQKEENSDLYSAYNGIEWQITAHVSARRVGQEWQATVAMRVWAIDPYDWEPYDVSTGASQVKTPVGLSQAQIGDLHKAGLAHEYLRLGWMDITEDHVFP